MQDAWYYEESEQSVGPVSLQELMLALSRRQNPKEVMIWGTGFIDWQRAGAVPEVRVLMPPPLISMPPPLSQRARLLSRSPARGSQSQGPKTGRIARTERRKRGFFGWFFLVVFLLFNGLMAVWLIAYWARVLPMTSAGSEGGRAGAAIGATIGTGVIISFWTCGAIVLGLFVLFTRGRKVIIEEEIG